MEIKVRGFRGAERADLTIAPIALIAGKNGAGKSSICQAVAAAIGSSPIPFYVPGRPDKVALTKSAAKGLLRGGMDKGYVEVLVDGKSVSRVDYPSFASKGNGSVASSLVVAGLVNPMDMGETERQRFFADLLKSEPSADDIEAELKDAGAPKSYIDTLIADLRVQGWDPLHKRIKEDGARFKGQWEATTGTAYGKLKADGWRPEGWSEALAKKSLEQIGTDCSEAQARLEKAIAAKAFDAGEIAAMEAAVVDQTATEDSLAKARDALDTARAQRDVAKKFKDGIVIPSAIPCPHCGATVDVGKNADTVKGGYVLTKATASNLDISKAELQADLAAKDFNAKQEAFSAAEASYNQLKGKHTGMGDARAALAAAKARTGSADDVDACRAALEALEHSKKSIEAVAKAESLANRISGNQIIVDMLAPEGLRRQKLTRALEQFNTKVLAPIAAEAEYQQVTISSDLDVLYGGRPYYLLSESEKYRVRAVLQIAIAQSDGSKLVILDGADILDTLGRNGLMNMLGKFANKAGLHFLVAMTVPKRENVPDLAKFDMGVSLWVNSGIAEPL